MLLLPVLLLPLVQGPSAERIRTADLLATIRCLAAPELAGRPAGSWEALAAARLLEFELQSAGCRPLPGARGLVQPLGTQLAAASRPSTLTVKSGDRATPLALGATFRPLPRFCAVAGTFRGDAVFLGYGIHAPELGYDDYQGLPAEALTGKAAVLVASRPRSGLPGAPGPGCPTLWRPRAPVAFTLDARTQEAARRGAALVVLLADPRPEALQATIDDQRDLVQFVPFLTETLWCEPCLPPTTRAQGTPAVHVLRRGAEALFGSRDELARRLEAIDQDLKPQSGPLADTAVTLELHLNHQPAPSALVAAVLPGSDPQLEAEFVLVTAHLDGTGRANDQRTVHPGANEGASGCAALAALAQALAAPASRPRRSLVLIAWTGRDRGLVASSAWVASPPLPLERTRAVLHLDGLGRAPLRVPDLATARRQLASSTRDPAARVASDQLPFLEHGVPALRFDDGATPKDATQDTPDRIDPELLTANARALAALIRALGDADGL